MQTLRNHNTKPRILTMAIMGLAFAFLLVYASGGLLIVAADSGGHVSSSLNQVIVGLNTPNPYFQVTVSAHGPQLPSQLLITLSTTYGQETGYNSQSCTASPDSDSNSVSCTFIVPIGGSGKYTFTGSVYDSSSGHLLAQSTIDPLVEPEWR